MSCSPKKHLQLITVEEAARTMAPLTAAGTARPSAPISVFAEDFSLLIRKPRRMRIARSKIRVLN